MKISLIAAVSVDGAIGNDDNMLWRIPGDLKHYKKLTTGNIVIIGRKTFETLPNVALKNRTHIVITKHKNIELDVIDGADVHISNSIDDAISLANALANDAREIYVAGGSMIYDEMIKYCDIAEITFVDKMFPNANKLFPLSKLFNDFELHEDKGWWNEDGMRYKITTYKRT